MVAGTAFLLVAALFATELSRSTPTLSATMELGRAESPGLPLGLDITLKLLTVLLLIYTAASLARRYLLKIPSAPHGLIRVLDMTTIAPKKSICVVEIGGRVLVLGATESGMTNLTEFDDPDTVASLIANAKPSGLGFQHYLEASLNRSGTAGALVSQPVDLLAKASRLRTGSER